MKTIGVREFRDHATRFLAGTELLAVSNRGVVIGFYIPVPKDREQSQRALEQLGVRVQEILTETGMSEEEFAALFHWRPEIK